MIQPIALKYEALQERVFEAVAMAEAPLLIAALAEALGVTPEKLDATLHAMVQNGAPLRFHTLPEGPAVSY